MQNKLIQFSIASQAKEYAKTVPKPKIAPKVEEKTEQTSARSMTNLADPNVETLILSHRSIPNSHSSPMISNIDRSNIQSENMTDQFAFLETIEALHKRHLEEKQLISTLKQKM